MSSRSLRVLLLVAGLGVTVAGSYVIYGAEQTRTAAAAAAATYATQARGVIDDLHALRAAQQAYVAEGQGPDYWIGQAAERLARIDRGVADLAAAATVDASRAATQAGAGALEKFRGLDARARQHVAAGQRLMASDLIFTDGVAALSAAVKHLDAAAAAERAARDEAADALHARQLFAAAGAIGVLLLLVLLLVPVPEADVDVLTAMRALTEGGPRLQPAAAVAASMARPSPPDAWIGDGESAARVVSRMPVQAAAAPAEAGPAQAPERVEVPSPQPVPSTPAAADATEATPAAEAPAPQSMQPVVDLRAAARVCADLARVLDAGDIPGLLARAASVLDAPGLIVWVADRPGHALFPLFTHGYSAQVLMRLGSLPADANNATAAAWRTGELRAVPAADGDQGAVVSPIVTAEGCVGVLAAEISGGRETREDVQALATIFAAQLATVVTPLSAEEQQAHAR